MSEDGLRLDVTHWLHVGRNTLSVVMFGPAGAVPFRLHIAAGGLPAWTLDEAELIPLPTPWRLWTCPIEVTASEAYAALGPHRSVPAGLLRRGEERRTSA
ncbi:hypothetical protein [Methylobacterium sp. JK268]